MMIKYKTFRKSFNYKIACITEFFRPVLRFCNFIVCGNKRISPSEWRRGILIGADHIGDVLWITPSLPFLKNGLPDCKWYYMANSPANELLKNNPHLAGYIPFSSQPKSITEYRTLLKTLRSNHFDVAICYNTGKYWRDLLLSLGARIPHRVGYIHKGFSGLVTHPVSIKYPQPYSAYFRDLVAQITSQKPDWPLIPLVYPTEEDSKKAEQLWNEFKLQADMPTVACFITSRQPTPLWPIEYFARTIEMLVEKESVQIALCGSADDEPVLKKFQKLCHAPCVINAGKLNLRSLVAFLQKCNVVISTDSGPRHLANAAGVPVVFIRNLWSNRIEEGKYCPTEIDISNNEEYLDNAMHLQALRQITPDTMVKAVITAIKR